MYNYVNSNNNDITYFLYEHFITLQVYFVLHQVNVILNVLDIVYVHSSSSSSILPYRRFLMINNTGIAQDIFMSFTSRICHCVVLNSISVVIKQHICYYLRV